jgi:hypothetical protein
MPQTLLIRPFLNQGRIILTGASMGDLDVLVNCLMHLEMAGVRNNTLVISSDADLHNWLGERGAASFDASSSIASFKDKSPTPKLVEKYRCTFLSVSENLLLASGSFPLPRSKPMPFFLDQEASQCPFFLDREAKTH